MPLESTLASATCVLRIEYLLPEKKDLAKIFRLEGEQLNYKSETEATVQMVFFGKYKIKVPTDEINDSTVLKSQAYLTLKQNFYEIVKNSIDANARQLELAIFKRGENEIEIVVGDRGGAGFRSGKYASYFTTANTLVNFNSIAGGAYKLPSEKKKGASLGGAGKGLIMLNASLVEMGGSLILQATEEYSAILRLKSLMILVSEEKLSKVYEAQDDEDTDDFSTSRMLNQIQLASTRRKQGHFDFSINKSSSEVSPEPGLKGLTEKGKSEPCSRLQLNGLFSPASTTEEEDDDEVGRNETLVLGRASPTS